MGAKHCTLVPCFTKTTRQLAKIEKEIKAVRSSFWNGKISHDQARKEIGELEDERDRLWAQDRS